VLRGLVDCLCSQADNFATLAAAPRYIVSALGPQALTLDAIRALSITRSAEVVNAAERVKALQLVSDSASSRVRCAQDAFDLAQRALDEAIAELPAAESACSPTARSVVAAPLLAMLATAATLHPPIATTVQPQLQLDSPSLAGKRSRRNQRMTVSAVSIAEGEFRDASSSLKAAQKAAISANGRLHSAEEDSLLSTAAAAVAVAVLAEIEGNESFVEVSKEEDLNAGIWSAPWLRYRRKGAAEYRAGIPHPPLCNKDYTTTKGFTPGLLVVSCEHGYAIFLKLLQRNESPAAVLQFLRDRCRPGFLPSRICYDNGCNLHSYVAARCPEICAVIQLFIDRLHFRNHVHCSTAYQIDRYTRRLKHLNFNSVIVEQLNRFIKRVATHVRFSTPPNAIRALCIVMMVHASIRHPARTVVSTGGAHENGAPSDDVSESSSDDDSSSDEDE
jgi:hypothetical protein